MSNILESVFLCVGWSTLKWSWPYACYEGVWGKTVIAPLILNLNTRWRWVIGLIPRWYCTRGKSPWCWLARTEELSGRFGKMKNLAPVLVMEPELLNHLSCSPVTVVTVPTFPLPMHKWQCVSISMSVSFHQWYILMFYWCNLSNCQHIWINTLLVYI